MAASQPVLWHCSLKSLALFLFKLGFNITLHKSKEKLLTGESFFFPRSLLFFLVLCGKFSVFSPVWTRGMLNGQDCCRTYTLLPAAPWPCAWDRVCYHCGAWQWLQAGGSTPGATLPEAGLLGKLWPRLMQGSGRHTAAVKWLMEINHFLIILWFRTDLLPSCVFNYYLHLSHHYESVLWYSDI